MSSGRAARARVALVLLLLQLTGCYQYVPVRTPQLPAGALVSVGLNDRGRVELAERIGPGVRHLGGAVVTTSDSAMVLAVSTVDYMDVPVPVRWNGERVQLSRQFLNEVRERRLSRSRSLIMAGVLTIGAALVSTLALTGFGSNSEPDRPGGGDTHQ
jgi:hypothetical protein